MQKNGFAATLFVWALLFSSSGFTEPLVKYHPNGKASVEGQLDENGLPHNTIRKFDEKGNIVSERNFHHGVLEGVSKMYYSSGELMTHWVYKKGKRHGVGIGYFRNGKIKDEGFYKDDKLDGLVKMYYEDGTPKTEMNFKEDRQEGTTRTYTKEGKLEFIYTHRKGRLINRKKFDADGKLILEQDYPVLQVHP
ncbi:MAG: hypothetical protein NPINA01_21130 [Nitrospinaceae bacterium]|nr:MAG: hypothetical protein NPINA01_21130 [Nitrospinaceae bacterium]